MLISLSTPYTSKAGVCHALVLTLDNYSSMADGMFIVKKLMHWSYSQRELAIRNRETSTKAWSPGPSHEAEGVPILYWDALS